MQENADENAPAPAFPIRLLAREALRAAAAFALYLILERVWTWLGAHEVYATIILGPARWLVLATQHFPTPSSLENLTLSYLDFLVLFTFCYLIVSYRMPWGLRLRRFGTLFAVIIVFHILAATIEIQVDLARVLAAREQFDVLLPWEMRLFDGFRFLLVNLGLQVGPFLVMLIAAGWNSGIGLPAAIGPAAATGGGSPGRRPRAAGPSRLRAWAAAAAGGLLLCGVLTTVRRAAREADPRHLRTHVLLGDLLRRDGRMALAEGQYRAAIDNGTTDGQAWYNLAGLLQERGDNTGSVRLLRDSLELVTDSGWRDRIRAALRSDNSPS